MPIVAHGLGLPEEGALVAGGLGLTEQVAGAMSATLTGSGTLTATLTATGATSQAAGRRRGQTLLPQRPLAPTTAPIAARLAGRSTFTATLDVAVHIDDRDLEELLALALI